MSGEGRVPRAPEAVVEEAKVRDYLLDADHREGGPKARFFARFGFERVGWPVLRDALARHAAERPASLQRVDAHGERHVAVCALDTPDGRNPCVVTVWLSPPGGGPPRLVTAFPGPVPKG